MSRTRYRYTPALRGWVVTRDMTASLVDSIDCSTGGAQEALARKCIELAAEGWILERRFADSLFAHRPPLRWRITIEAYDPAKPTPRTHTTP